MPVHQNVLSRLRARCTAKLGRNQGQFHHLRSLLSGGPDTAANGQHLCVKCHQNTASYGG